MRECIECVKFFECEFKSAKKEGCIHFEKKEEKKTLLDKLLEDRDDKR